MEGEGGRGEETPPLAQPARYLCVCFSAAPSHVRRLTRHVTPAPPTPLPGWALKGEEAKEGSSNVCGHPVEVSEFLTS